MRIHKKNKKLETGVRRHVNSNLAGYSLGNCVVTKLLCTLPNSTLVVKELVCDSSVQCWHREFNYTCGLRENCYTNLNISSCICPIDRSGPSCATDRLINCSVNLISPPPDCGWPAYQDLQDPKDYLLDGDRACYVYGSIDSLVELDYALNCNFITSSSNSNSSYSFSYWLDASPQFALSRPQDWSLRLKLFNFNKLSDNNATFWVNLTKDQMMGSELFRISFALNEINERYWHGNRIYGELAWQNINHSLANGVTKTNQTTLPNQIRQNPAGAQNVMHRIFIDSPAHVTIGNYVAPIDNTWLIVGLICGAIVLLILVYVVYKCRKNRQKKREREEQDRLMSRSVHEPSNQ